MDELNSNQIQAAQLLASGKSITDTAEEVGVSRQTIHDWQKNNYVFIAELNSLKLEIREAGRQALQSSIALAVDTINSIMSNSDNDLARLKAAHDILYRTGIFKPESIGSINPEKVRDQIIIDRMMES